MFALVKHSHNMKHIWIHMKGILHRSNTKGWLVKVRVGPCFTERDIMRSLECDGESLNRSMRKDRYLENAKLQPSFTHLIRKQTLV